MRSVETLGRPCSVWFVVRQIRGNFPGKMSRMD